MSLKRVLLVEPDRPVRQTLHTTAAAVAQVESHASFATARERLLLAPFDVLVTNVRLGAYNGLHLVYLSRGPGAARAIVYTDTRDLGLAREVLRAGAFYEIGEYLSVTLNAYLIQPLPPSDRRAPARPDRRRVFRGGRRSWDLHLASRPG